MMNIPHIDKKCTNLTLVESFNLLRKEHDKGQPIQVLELKTIPLEKVKYATKAMQPRSLDEMGTQLSKDHINNLTEALAVSKQQELDPILVWWSGKHHYCIDGHHRLEAYKALNRQGKLSHQRLQAIPCRLFIGTLEEAIAKAMSENSKDKMPMTKREKLNRAWQFTCLGIFSINQTSEVCKVATRTVSNMRTKYKELLAWSKHMTPEYLGSLSWEEVSRLNQPKREFNDAWEDEQIEKWAKALGKTFGSKFRTNPDLAASAVLRYYGENIEPLKAFFGTIKEDLELDEKDTLTDF